MRRVEVVDRMGTEEIAAISPLLEEAAAFDDHAALSEEHWLRLVSGADDVVGLVAWGDEPIQPLGYAQLTRGTAGWSAETVVSPGERTPSGNVAEALLRAALTEAARRGGGELTLWVSKATDEWDRLATACGLRVVRDLLQLRRPLPAEQPPPIELRAFRVGRDEAAWLEVNKRAFAWHPEQGGWDMEALAERESQPWFDPGGFLLHEVDGKLAGFCWTKIHQSTTPPLGEIYVIAVDPAFQGRGLGRALVLGGLHHLWNRGISMSMLYVDGENSSARAMYDKLGFSVDHVDRAYAVDLTARPS